MQVKGKERNTSFLKELLEQHIESYHVLGAIETYELLEKTPTGTEKLNDNIQQNLLELLCYHNNEEELDSESHPLLGGLPFDDNSYKWKGDGLAERIYSDIVSNKRLENTHKDHARLALLCGKAKFQNEGRSMKADNAASYSSILQLQEECKVRNIIRLICNMGKSLHKIFLK